MNKKFLILALLLVAAITLVGCTQKAAEPTATPVPAATASAAALADVTLTAEPEAQAAPIAETGDKTASPIELTVEELAKFNGKDGQPAYVAVDGIIYDVTESAPWKNGDHNGFEAGKDLTKEIKGQSPHGIGKLDKVIEVGKLITK